MLDQTTEVNLLYDFYGTLLTEKQQKLLELYFQEDWSLGEIAKHQNVSRQAVYEAIKRAQQTLLEYEQKLGLLLKYRERLKIVQAIQAELAETEIAKKVEPHLSRLLELE